MKKGIHPKYYDNTTITCSCGAVLEAGSTKEKMQVEICSQCHPFYTGNKKMIDTTGRVDRFKKLTERTNAKQEAAIKAKVAAKAKTEKAKPVKAEKAKKPVAKKTAKKK
jgi:large subunit ribosomal protein L31